MRAGAFSFAVLARLALIGGVPGASGAEFHVATTGLDAADGSVADPFRTIQRAADVMQPGDVCTVHGGTYREWVRPPRGGDAESRRIVYRAAPGEEVVVKGSERAAGWVREGPWWRIELPDTFFGGRNPFKRHLAGEWLTFGTEYHLGEVHLDGVTLRERLSREALADGAMGWWIEPAEGRTVLLANFGGADPNARLTEINVREGIFFPTVKGLKYLTVEGFTFTQASPQWAYWNAYEEAAVGTYFGQHWLIQNCRFTDIRCVALVCGNDAHTPTGGQDIRDIGRHVVQNNTFARCGEGAIHGNWGWAGSLIEGNLIEDINVKNEFGGQETAGIKIHYAVDVTVKGNVIRRVLGKKPAATTGRFGAGFVGLWIDWGAQGTRVTGNVVYEGSDRALFVQNSLGSPVLVDHNILQGNCMVNTPGVVFAHNLFVDSGWTIRDGTKAGPYWRPHTGDRAGLADGKPVHLKWWNNLFAGRGADTFPFHEGCASDWNVFLGGAKPSAWGDQASVSSDFQPGVTFRSRDDGVEIRFAADAAPGRVPTPLISREFVGVFPLTGQGLEDQTGRAITLDRDLTGAPRPGTHPLAGPWANLTTGENRFQVRAGALSGSR